MEEWHIKSGTKRKPPKGVQSIVKLLGALMGCLSSGCTQLLYSSTNGDSVPQISIVGVSVQTNIREFEAAGVNGHYELTHIHTALYASQQNTYVYGIWLQGAKREGGLTRIANQAMLTPLKCQVWSHQHEKIALAEWELHYV